MKKAVSFFVSMSLFFSVTMSLFADTETVNGIQWTYKVSNGEAILGGEQPSGVCVVSLGPLAVDCSTAGAIVIPSVLGGIPVTGIGHYAFSCCRGLTSVTIPDSVTSIGDSAFSSCSGLTSVTIPDSVTNIGYSAFSGCRGLTSVTIPSSVTSIRDSVFSRCSGLTSVTIPDSVTSIGEEAFCYCTSLRQLKIPDSVTSYGANCFEGCPAYTLPLYRAIFSGNSGSGSSVVVTTVVQNVAAPYALAEAPGDRAIASVAVDRDCSIDEFILSDGKVYDSVLRIANTSDSAVKLTLPVGYSYEAFDDTMPLIIPPNSVNLLTLTRTADKTFLVSRRRLKSIER